MTVEHLRPLMESGVCTALLGEVATQFARGQVPEEVLPAVRLGRMTALQKPDGGVRGIVVGCVSEVGWSDSCQAIRRARSGGNTSLPIRSFHPCRHGMCCTRCEGAYQSRSKCHHLVHRWCWGLRFNFEKGDVSWPHGHGGRREVGALRETLLRQPLNVHMGRRGRGCLARVARRRWRTR